MAIDDRTTRPAGDSGPAAGDPTPEPDGSAISLTKLGTLAPDLVGHYQAAKVTLRKRRLVSERAAVYLVVDHSGSMRRFFRDGSVQLLAERVLALSAHLDDDGTVPVVFFDTIAHPPAEVVLGRHAGAVERIRSGLGRMGRTDYAAAMRAVIDHYVASGATDPALVVFQTDGSPTSRAEATRTLCQAAELPIFWQFVGFGDDEFAYLRRLDELAVPRHRRVDNTGFFPAGSDPSAVPDETLYRQLTAEYPSWLAAAREAGVVRS